MNCSICKKEVKITFLDKPLGTYVKDSKGKKHIVCRACQTTLKNDKNSMIEKF